MTDPAKLTDDDLIAWIPTSDGINKLPEPLRRYIHDLETNCDPAGLVRENVIAKDTIAQLAERLAETLGLSEMVCEQHPELEWPHGDCAGPGCSRSAQVRLIQGKRRFAAQALRERDILAGEAAKRSIELADELAETRAQVEQMREMAAEIRAEIDDQVSVNATPNQRAHATITIEVRSLMPLLDLFPATEPGGE